MSEKIIENQTFDEERALYGEKNLVVRNCRFDGPADGESAFKECENVTVDGAFMNLRYPFWHDRGLALRDVEMTELCRAALWYSEDVTIEDSRLHGIKALRECRGCAAATSCLLSSAGRRAASRWSHARRRASTS